MRRTGWILMAALAAPLACGPSDVTIDEPQLPEAELAEAELAVRFAEAMCEQRIACGCYDPLSGPVGEDPEAATRAQCVESRRLEIEHWQQEKVAGLRYDGACAQRQLHEMRSWGCADRGHLDLAAAAAGTSLCAEPCRIYTGTGARGASCDGGCGQGLRCIGRFDEQSWEYVYRCGDPCLDGGETCGTRVCGLDQVCRFSDATCQPLPAEGEPCPDYACAWPSTCVPDATDTWRCVAGGDDGAICSEVPFCIGTCVDGTCGPGTPRVCAWDPRSGS